MNPELVRIGQILTYVSIAIRDGRCVLCGCTDLQACPGGCSWVIEGVCSSHLEFA